MRKIKKICFEALEKNYVDLKIRLRYDNLSQIEFFNMLIQMYLEKNMHVLTLINDYKLENAKAGRRRIAAAQNDIKFADEFAKQLKLDEKDKEDIFDIIEDKTGEI